LLGEVAPKGLSDGYQSLRGNCYQLWPMEQDKETSLYSVGVDGFAKDED
jgi:hypothetical protein